MREFAVYETAAIVEALDVDGFAFLPRVLSATQCEEARGQIDTLMPLGWDEAHDDPQRGGRFLDRYLCVFNREPYWLQFLDRPGVIDVAETALGVDCHVIGQTAWRSHPGFRGEPLHADYLPFTWADGELPEIVRVPSFILTTHFYLSEVTSQLSPTRLIGGSHRAGRAPRADEQHWRGTPAVPVLAGAGDALVFRSDLWHAGSDNSSAGEMRYLLQVHYGRREIAQHFSSPMDWRFDPRILAAATRRQRRLLGEHDPGAYD